MKDVQLGALTADEMAALGLCLMRMAHWCQGKRTPIDINLMDQERDDLWRSRQVMLSVTVDDRILSACELYEMR